MKLGKKRTQRSSERFKSLDCSPDIEGTSVWHIPETSVNLLETFWDTKYWLLA